MATVTTPHGAHEVVKQEMARAHGCGTRHKRHERPHDRYEAGQNHRFAAVLLEELVRPLHMCAIDQL